eukprot:7621627-Pyramimonas_sp.AAC.1
MDVVGTSLAQGLKQHRLAVSSKSVILGSSASLAKKSARRLRARGVPVRPVMQGVDLGVDVAAARRR